MPTIQQLVGTRVRELRKARGWTLEALVEKADKHYCNVAYVAAETEPYIKTSHGEAVQGRAEDVLPLIPDGSVDLIFTSPPYALHFKKEFRSNASGGCPSPPSRRPTIARCWSNTPRT